MVRKPVIDYKLSRDIGYNLYTCIKNTETLTLNIVLVDEQNILQQYTRNDYD